MKMKAISLIILIMLGVGFLSGCNEQTDLEQENKSPIASISANPKFFRRKLFFINVYIYHLVYGNAKRGG